MFARSSALAVLLLLTPTLAFAQSDTRVSVTETALVEYRIDNKNRNEDDDDYGTFLNRLNVTGNAGGISSALRIDSNYFYDEPTSEFRNQARLERINIGYDVGEWELEAGDFYQQLGRGIVLGLRKIDEAGLDVAIRGGAIDYTGSNHRARVFAGRINPVNIDVVTQRQVNDTDDTVVGGNYELRAIDGVQWSIFGAYIEPATSQYDRLPEVAQDRFADNARIDRTTGVGTGINLASVVPWMGLYVEGDWQVREELEEVNRGNAVYGTADFFAGDWSFVLEGGRIKTFRVEGGENSVLSNAFVYNQPPTLERFDMEVLNRVDFHGLRAYVERFIFAWNVNVFGNFLWRVTDPDTEAEVRQFHGYAGFEAFFQNGASRFYGTGGYRDENQTRIDSGNEFKNLIHVDFDYLQYLGGPWSLHTQTFTWRQALDGRWFWRSSSLFGVEHSRIGALTFEFGVDDQNTGDNIRNKFYAVILQGRIGERYILTATAGTQRGGIKCINGVCRDFPAFAGGRLEFVARF